MEGEERLMKYEIEELLPLVAKLAAKYTSGESSSIPYETAGRLLEAVCCCIQESEKGEDTAAEEIECGQAHGLTERSRLTAAESYCAGYEIIVEKTRRAQEKYNELCQSFRDYGNENYHDTLSRLAERLMKSGWGNDAELLWYLQGDIEDFAAELEEGVRRNKL